MTLTMLTRICPGCGAGFSVNLGSKRKYCSDPCKEHCRPHRDHTATPGLVINARNPHHHPATAKALDGCVHRWTLDSYSHGVCQTCGAEHDYSPLYKKYRGAFVKIGGRE